MVSEPGMRAAAAIAVATAATTTLAGTAERPTRLEQLSEARAWTQRSERRRRKRRKPVASPVSSRVPLWRNRQRLPQP
eukprot:9557383-Alexandrium_andersonii.AAC.1